MGNSIGCSASGERLVSAARDGDAVEARMLLDLNPALARYSTFGGVNSPLHFAAAKGHLEIVTLLLESGADVNARNYCGQTALMHACRHGHWEVVQTLLIFRSNVTRVDYLSGRTALHFAAIDGHVRCIRLLLADFVPSAPIEQDSLLQCGADEHEGREIVPNSSTINKLDHSARLKFINKPADGGVTALHMAALSGSFDCVQLLIDLGANVVASTLSYGTSANLIGGGSTPLHYAACGGNLKCCQILLSKGASRLTLNCNGWLPADVARIWGRHWLQPLLTPQSSSAIPTFPLSCYLSLPLMSILNIARECGLQCSNTTSDETDNCAVCLERTCSVAAEGCAHEFCVKCALYLCSTTTIPSETASPPGSVPCPLCRHGIVSFTKLQSARTGELKPSSSLGLCNPCIIPTITDDSSSAAPSKSEIRRNRVAAVSSELVCPLTCNPFPSGSLATCSWNNEAQCSDMNTQGESEPEAPNPLSGTVVDVDKTDDDDEPGRSSCSGIFWARRSCQREQQCAAEINA